jgi:hypothetical protein
MDVKSPTLPRMTTSETSRYVRVQVELVLEIEDPGQVSSAALDRIAADESMPEDERTHAGTVVREDDAEALAYLIEPFDLVSGVPGVQLAQASWSSEQIDYDPEAVEWDPYDGDGDEDDDAAAEAGTTPDEGPGHRIG